MVIVRIIVMSEKYSYAAATRYSKNTFKNARKFSLINTDHSDVFGLFSMLTLYKDCNQIEQIDVAAIDSYWITFFSIFSIVDCHTITFRRYSIISAK